MIGGNKTETQGTIQLPTMEAGTRCSESAVFNRRAKDKKKRASLQYHVGSSLGLGEEHMDEKDLLASMENIKSPESSSPDCSPGPGDGTTATPEDSSEESAGEERSVQCRIPAPSMKSRQTTFNQQSEVLDTPKLSTESLKQVSEPLSKSFEIFKLVMALLRVGGIGAVLFALAAIFVVLEKRQGGNFYPPQDLS